MNPTAENQARFSWGSALFLAAYLLCLNDAMVFGYSSFGEYVWVKGCSRALEFLSLVLILTKLYLDRYYKRGTIFWMAVMALILGISFLRSGYNHIFYLLIVCLGIRTMDPNQILRVDFQCRCAVLLFIILSSLLTIISNYVTHRTGSDVLRYSLGFNHPNTLAALVMSLTLEESLISERRGSTGYALLIWSLAAVVFVITQNRTAVIIMAVYPILLLLWPQCRMQSNVGARACGMLGAVFYPALTALSWSGMLRSKGNGFGAALDRVIGYRLSNSLRLYRQYGVPLLGQHVKLVSVKAAREGAGSIGLLDVAFLRTLIQGGILLTGFYAFLYGCMFLRVYRRQQLRLALVSVLLLLFGLCESGFNNVFMNFTILFAAASLYETKTKGR